MSSHVLRHARIAGLLYTGALAALGCAGTLSAGGSTRGRAVNERRPRRGVEVTDTRSRLSAPTAELSARLDLVAEAFRERHAAIVRERWSTFLPSEGVAVLHVSVAEDRCVGFVAVGHEAMGNIDLFVHNRAGVRVAWDERDDAHPYARICVRGGEELYVIVEAKAGPGEVGVLTVVDPPTSSPDLDAVLHVRNFGQFSGPRVPRISLVADPAVPDAVRAMELYSARFVQMGYRREGTQYSGRFENATVEARDVLLEQNHCYVVMATGGRGIDDIDLSLHPPGEVEPLRDRQPDNHPTIRFCANETAPHRIEVHAVAGIGTWNLAVLQLHAPSPVPDDIVDNERAFTMELLAEGRRRSLEPIAPPRRHAVTPGVRIRFPARLRAGRCYMFGAAGDRDVPDIDLALRDAHGRLLAADTVALGAARLFHCARHATQGQIEVNVAGGRGEVAYVAMRSATPGTATPTAGGRR